jgi:hypothetical protein
MALDRSQTLNSANVCFGTTRGSAVSSHFPMANPAIVIAMRPECPHIYFNIQKANHRHRRCGKPLALWRGGNFHVHG